MRVLGFGLTDVGKKRGHNEDSFLVEPELGLYMVCDGMGGHAGGEVASAAACQVVRRHIEENRKAIDGWDESAPARDALIRLVDTAIQSACHEIFGQSQADQKRAGMGTTLTMMLVVKNVAVMGHVGDTRLYMRRSGKLHQLSEDHTYVNEMSRRGMGTIEELSRGPYANVITRAVGIQPNVHVDTLLFDLLGGDTFLLCSDGLSKHTEGSQELSQMMDNDHLESLPKQLIDVANSRGGSDNITALILRAEVEDGEDANNRNRTTEVTLKLDTLKQIALFSHLDMGELCKILNVVRATDYATGEVILREGEHGECLYAILDGSFAVTRGGKPIAALGAGAHFGEMALFNNRLRSATVTAREPSQVLVMERERFNELVRKEPQLGVKVLWAVAQVLSLRLDETSVQLYGPVTDTALSAPFQT